MMSESVQPSWSATILDNGFGHWVNLAGWPVLWGVGLRIGAGHPYCILAVAARIGEMRICSVARSAVSSFIFCYFFAIQIICMASK